jgi:hypothetical protein
MIDKTYLIILKQQTKMRKILTYAVSALALASCSSDSLVSDSPANTQAPIAFNAGQKNITRAPFEKSFDNFRVWAYKYKTDASTGKETSAKVMDNYEVGYKTEVISEVSKTVWYYEGLGSPENKQVLHYWDYSYANTNFYAYAPYNSKVTFAESSKTITVPSDVNTASTSKASDFVYAGNSVVKDKYNNAVELKFKRLGAIVNLKFWTDIDGYDVKLIDADPSVSGSAIQATPTADKISKSKYYTAYDAVINYSKNPSAPTVDTSGTPTKVDDNLKFTLPAGNLPTASTDAVSSGTTYYAVAQPTTSTTGFTFHVSYQLTAKDNSEVITVRDARVFVPASVTDTTTDPATTTYIAAWQPNTQYTYTFKITTNTNGKTAEENINLNDPSVPEKEGLYPIVFDYITIEDMTNVTY